jgi:iron(III) transport system substrate-binding protein
MLELSRSFPLFVLLAVLTACSGQAIGAVSDDTSQTLTIYSGRSESLVRPVIEQFQEASGIDVEVRYGATSEMAATLLEEGNNSPADVFFAQDPGGLGAVTDLLAPLPEDILHQVDGRFRDPNGRWVGISGRGRAIVYNTETLKPEDLPQDLRGFTDPQWKRRIGWAPTNGSFQTMVTAMRIAWGEEETRQWLEDILANEPVAYGKNTPIVAAVGAGEVDVGFVNHYYLYRFLQEEGESFSARNYFLPGGGPVGFVNHYYLYRFLQEEGESFSARNYFLPGGGPGSLVMVAGAGVVGSSDNQEAAHKFLRFMLSPVAQQYFATQTFEYPLVEGVRTQRELPPLAELNAIQVDLANLADLEGTLALLRDVGALP